MERNLADLSYTIASLVKPVAKSPQARRVWSIDLESVLVPYFTACNVTGAMQTKRDALGAPIRLRYDKDGAVKFNDKGRPMTEVARPIRDGVSLIRENLIATMSQYAHAVATERAEQYADERRQCLEAGAPIVNRDKTNLDAALTARLEKQLAEAAAEVAVQAPAEVELPKEPALAAS